MVDMTDPAIGLSEPRTPAAHSRRLKPAEMDSSSSAENRVPLRAEKINRRESRLGLRNIFSRKTSNDEDSAAVRDAPSRSAGIRASVAQFGNWPYSLGHKSEIILPFRSQPSSSQLRPRTPPATDPSHERSPSVVKVPPSPKSSQRAAWDPPPLFQAYPQAIRHAQLPACTLSAEAIIRLYGPKGVSLLRDGYVSTIAEDGGTERADKSKRRHRRTGSGSSFKGDWTTKIYILVTSGYLLQYAGEGSFDRLPEKMLRLGKNSAAFASDVIPGRHWVLQVSSAMNSDGAAASSSASIFSRLPFRAVERKQTSNFLMVFESAEDMEGWIGVLRREIEALGGKKSLSETGKPRVDDKVLHLRAQPSQRTLVVRDPDRFSRVLPQDIAWDQPDSVANPGIRLSVAESDASHTTHDQSFDDTSTASGVSQDGRQLDGLRDSTHRLSYMSSGQRTVVTSAGSSPACSPVRDSFGSQLGDSPARESPKEEEQPWQPRRRPNASAILDRRQSVQAVNHLAEMRVVAAARPLSTTYSSSWQNPHTFSQGVPAAQTIPNFSVPHSAGKRFSLTMQPAPDPMSSSLSMQQNLGIVRPPRRPPPTAISINPRPLSLVVDHPSPEPTSPQCLSKQIVPREELMVPDTPTTVSPLDEEQKEAHSVLDRSATAFETSLLAAVQHPDNQPSHPRARKHPSTSTIRVSELIRETEIPLDPISQPIQAPFATERPSSSSSSSSFVTKNPRSRSAMEHHARSKSPPLSPGPWNGHFKRFSLRPSSPDMVDDYPRDDSEITVTITSISPKDSIIRSHTPTLFKSTPGKSAARPSSLLSGQYLGIGSKGIIPRRSMPRLTDIPPPAPPPTCALPPLPPTRRVS